MIGRREWLDRVRAAHDPEAHRPLDDVIRDAELVMSASDWSGQSEHEQAYRLAKVMVRRAWA